MLLWQPYGCTVWFTWLLAAICYINMITIYDDMRLFNISTNVLQIRNWRTLLHRRSVVRRRCVSIHQVAALCCVNDVMAAILKLWRQFKIRLRQLMRIYLRTLLPNFIPIRFQMTEPYAIFEERCRNKNNKKISSVVAIWDQFLIQELNSSTRHHHH